MESPFQRKYNCQNHPDQQIIFVCAVNDWHFEPLCQLCTPSHTHNHVKRLKISLQSFDEINKKVVAKEPYVSSAYVKQIQAIKQVQAKYIMENFPLIKDIKLMEQKIIGKIKNYFIELNQKVCSRLKNLLTQNSEKVKSLQLNLESQIKCIQQICNADIDVYGWKTSAKKIYFENKLESYLQESKQIIQEFEQKCGEMGTVKKKQLFSDQNKFFSSLMTVISTQVKTLVGDNFNQSDNKIKAATNPKKIAQKDLVKRPVVKQKSRQCKNCNEQMEYLTENKKHLICRFCNFKERNYTKKPA